jgi:hypothetical protein
VKRVEWWNGGVKRVEWRVEWWNGGVKRVEWWNERGEKGVASEAINKKF